MAQQTDAQLATLAGNAGLTGQDLEIAVAVLIATSEGVRGATADELRRYLERARAAIQAQSSSPTTPPTNPPTNPPATPQVPAPATPQTPSTSQQNPVQGFLAEFTKLIEAIAKLQNPARNLAKAAQAAGNAAVSEGAFGRVAGSPHAQRGNVRNTKKLADDAMKGKTEVERIKNGVDNAKNKVKEFDQRYLEKLNMSFTRG